MAGGAFITPEELAQFAARCRELGIDPDTVSDYKAEKHFGSRGRALRLKWLRERDNPAQPLPPKQDGKATAEDTFRDNEWQAYRVTSERARNEKDVARICGADLNEWRIKEWKVKAYESFAMPRAIGSNRTGWERQDGKPIVIPLYSVWVAFERKTEVIAVRNEVEELKRKAESYAPKYPHLVFDTKTDDNLLELSIADHHFGALIWGRETGVADWDLNIARKTYQDAVASLIARTGHHRFERALYIVGHDQHNSDNRSGTTERGTQQQNDGRLQKVWWTSRDTSVWTVEALCTVASQVDVIVVPGNHDPTVSFFLGDYLYAWFHANPNVRVHNEPTPRKIIEYGNVMLAFEHQVKKLEDYGKYMASEYPEIWGRTKWREAHTAHIHHRNLVEVPGATIRSLPSLRPPCYWSSENLFLGSLRCAEAFCWNKHEGLIGTGVYSVLGKRDKAA